MAAPLSAAQRAARLAFAQQVAVLSEGQRVIFTNEDGSLISPDTGDPFPSGAAVLCCVMGPPQAPPADYLAAVSKTRQVVVMGGAPTAPRRAGTSAGPVLSPSHISSSTSPGLEECVQELESTVDLLPWPLLPDLSLEDILFLGGSLGSSGSPSG